MSDPAASGADASVTVHATDDLVDALRYSRHRSGRRLGEVLVARGLLSPEQLAEALARLREQPGQQLGQWLVAQGRLTPVQVADAVAEQLGIPRVRLKDFAIDPAAAALVPDSLALRYGVLPLALVDHVLVVATSNPLDDQALNVLRFYTNHAVEPVLAGAEEIAQALDRYYALEAEHRALAELRPAEVVGDSDTALDEALRRPVVQLVSATIHQAIHRGASDINIRPEKDRVAIYYRIDGRLRLIRSLQRNLLPAIVARIKVTAGMDIAERRRPQDGHARVHSRNRDVDLRISVIPTVTGESVVIRILDKESGVRPLDELGFIAQDMRRLRQMISRPQGIILITGPTGSGKSTTLYAMLQEIRSGDPHIITVEEPVEYDMDGIEQIQVNSAIGYSFAEALRHILRHDPDVIMVGEIRDLETARIANKAALTGHLVLSTLHTNDAASAVTRLIDMGVEPYLLSSTLIGVMAQRLVRLNCPRCLAEEEASPLVREALKIGADERFYAGRGCEACDGSGYHGRAAVYELLPVTAEIAALVTRAAPAAEIKAAAVAQGMVPLTRNALALARERRTSLNEVYEVRLE